DNDVRRARVFTGQRFRIDVGYDDGNSQVDHRARGPSPSGSFRAGTSSTTMKTRVRVAIMAPGWRI
ncbi:hypothetical protein, partial [Actinoplanes philippinensis]|uniref:hypothetical protein n=1 Tax=Actinoplanes philippinensis TaxID=35752 RepID=UPI0033D04732